MELYHIYVKSDMILEHHMESFRALKHSGMKVSRLEPKNLSDQTAEDLTIVLAEYQLVQTLDLSCDNFKKGCISSAAAVSLFRSLEHNTSLGELDLSGNSYLAEGDGEAVGCALERMLNVNRTLKVLNLSGCQVTDLIVKHIYNWTDQEHIACETEHRIMQVKWVLCSVLSPAGDNLSCSE